LSNCFTIGYVTENVSARRWSSRDSRVSGASRSRPASRKLQRLVLVSSRTKFWTSRSRRHGSWVSSRSQSSEGLMHIPGNGTILILVLFS